MQIAIKQERSITFKLSDNGDDDASSVFGRIMNKCAAEAKKKGFKNMFTAQEKAFLLEFQSQVIFEQSNET